jgi:hypothetical protein
VESSYRQADKAQVGHVRCLFFGISRTTPCSVLTVNIFELLHVIVRSGLSKAPPPPHFLPFSVIWNCPSIPYILRTNTTRLFLFYCDKTFLWDGSRDVLAVPIEIVIPVLFSGFMLSPTWYPMTAMLWQVSVSVKCAVGKCKLFCITNWNTLKAAVSLYCTCMIPPEIGKAQTKPWPTGFCEHPGCIRSVCLFVYFLFALRRRETRLYVFE